jgi:thiamine monophosphate kinase
VRCVLLLDAIPRVAGVSIAQALSSGEEYELLVAAPVSDAAKFSAEFAAANEGLSLTAVGRVEALAPLDARGASSATDASGEVVAEQAGLRVAMPSSARAFDHFAAPER